MADLTLVLQAEARADQLVLRYTVRNGLAQDVYLLNRLYTNSPPRMSPDIAYVELEAATKLVRVFKGLAPIPSGSTSGPAAPVAPYVTPVRAGATFSEFVRIASPVRVYREYGRSPRPLMPPEEHITQFQGVSFALGWYARAPGVNEMADKAFDQPVVVPTGFRAMPDIRTTTSEVVPLAIPVILPR